MTNLLTRLPKSSKLGANYIVYTFLLFSFNLYFPTVFCLFKKIGKLTLHAWKSMPRATHVYGTTFHMPLY